MAKRQITNILANVGYSPAKHRQVSNILANVENKPAKYRQVSNILAMVAVEREITITYNRAAAAQRTISLSQANFRAFANGGFPENYSDVSAVVGKVDRSSPHDYSAYLTHRPGATGSAIFISDCIHSGGLPMTVRPNTNPNSVDCDSTDLNEYLGGYSSNGWRICPNQQGATNTWRNHQGIIAYFTANSVGLGGQKLTPSIFLDDIVDVIYQMPETGNAGNLKEGQPEYPTARDALISKLNTAPLNTLKAGDYIYVANSSGGDNHGFVVVGWGPLLGTLQGIGYALANTLSISRAALDQTHVIPYVADFCFGTKDGPEQGTLDSQNSDDRTGWLQDPRPRPFYSTHVRIVDGNNLRTDQVNYLKRIHYPSVSDPVIVAYQEFNFAQWDFYKIPDTASVPYGRIFFP